MPTKKTKPASDTAARKTKHFGHEYDPTETNWTNVSFPADPIGLTGRLRSEFRNTIQRCRGSDEKFQQILDNLEVMLAWAEVKLAADKEANKRAAETAAAKAAEHERREAFRARIQAGPSIRVSATATGFIERSARDGSARAVYDTADDARGPVAAMAQMMIAEGRDPNSRLEIDAFGRPGIGSGQTLAELADAPNGEAPAPHASGGLRGIKA